MERSFDMSKSKRARSIKARSASKIRSKTATRKSAAHQRTRANSKQARGGGGGVSGGGPLAGLRRALVGRMIAAALGEGVFGVFDRDSLGFWASLGRPQRPPHRQLKPGTVLVREYQGRRHIVTTVHDGFDCRERHIPASQRSHAPSPARPGVGRASLPCKQPATASNANQPPLPMM